jgi:hypothetical protein
MVCQGSKELLCLDAMDALRACPLFENADSESVVNSAFLLLFYDLTLFA